MKLEPVKHLKGQGLVEYALILILVAVVSILILVVLGGQTQNVFCDILLALGENAPEVEACEAPRVSCDGVGNGATVSNPVMLEAVVRDDDGLGQIDSVKFYVDGNHIRTEHHYRYCLGGGDSSCNSHSLSSGPHIIRAVATDDGGHSGECEVKITVE